MINNRIKETFEMLLKVSLESRRVAQIQLISILDTWGPLTEFFYRCGEFLFTNFLIFLSFCLGPESLPGKGAIEEVDEDVAQGLHVITPRLLWNKRIK